MSENPYTDLRCPPSVHIFTSFIINQFFRQNLIYTLKYKKSIQLKKCFERHIEQRITGRQVLIPVVPVQMTYILSRVLPNC